MPHLAVTRPLGVFYFADEPRNKPRRLVLVLHLLAEGLLASAQGLHFSIEGFQHRLVEAGADMPRVDPALLRFVAYGKCQRSRSTCATCAAQCNRLSPPPAHVRP